ncbi:hypothetical protein EUTSA_v10026382mg [Eutrema salsugineum]|uniref:Uncharacterized protein n=1 Tax=Eutrema salsugineum TaxID=72664 RepID=V4MEJ0_EUTSA|nr:uncharacterized protein LOC18030732 [Eutrema salsugineum]ESQ54894.1 hypothetical protein EUTSA_v10026382mg [Eutrema salsugineum]
MRRGKEEDEVEQLLQAAQDEMILKLSVDSHTSSSKSDYLDPDLHSRFLALRSQPSSKKKDYQHRQKRRPRSPPKSKDVEETPDDLMLRFAALKSSLPSSSSSVSPSVPLPDEIGEDADDIGEDDEVEKLIQWAIDAARLDPSPPSDDDDDDNRSSDNDDDFDDDDNGSTRNVKA